MMYRPNNSRNNIKKHRALMKTLRTPNKRHRITKRMNCSPAVKKISVKDSCYTPKILFMIRDAYNADHPPEDRIHESNPTTLWKILNDRLVQCSKEDCWLSQIKDENLKTRIDRYIFAPDKPYEWKSNPNTWLSNFDIMNVLEQYEQTYKHFKFIGPTPIDFDKVVRGKCVQNELCNFNLHDYIKRGKSHIGIIFNLSPHTSSGSHWVSLFIDTKKRVIFYFDSAGDTIPDEIDAFVKRVQSHIKQKHRKEYTFYENAPNEHQMGNTECGVYSLFFIITMLTGIVNHDKDSMRVLKTKRGQRLNMAEKIRLFKEGTIPDEYIEKYRNVYFND
jgi:hypothetical protein